MTERIDLKNLEKKAWRSTFQDGLWDIYLGLIFFGLGIGWIGDYIGLFYPFGTLILIFSIDIIAVLIITLGKKYISTPRLGQVKFGEKRKKRKKWLKIFLSLNVIFSLIIFSLTITGNLDQFFTPGLFTPLALGLMGITVPISVLAFYLQVPRLYIYALSGGFGFFFSELLYPLVGEPWDIIISYGSIGGSILLIGLVIFIRFLQKYPLEIKR
jgi:hypothetical protein